MDINQKITAETLSANLGSSNSTETESFSKLVSKKIPRKKWQKKFQDDTAMFYSKVHHKRKSFNENPITCEQIVEVEDDMIDEENKPERRRRWFHPKMLFDAEDQQLGLNMKNASFNVGFKTDGRSKSSEQIRMPKIIEIAVEDDTNILTLSHYRTNKFSSSNKFINRVDNVENKIVKPVYTNIYSDHIFKLNSNTNSAYRGQYNENTIEEKSDEGKKSSDSSDDANSLSIKCYSGNSASRLGGKSSRKSNKRKESGSGSGISSPHVNKSLKKVIVDEPEQQSEGKVYPKSRKEDFVIIEEQPKEEQELDQNEEMAEQFKQKHAKMRKDSDKQVNFFI